MRYFTFICLLLISSIAFADDIIVTNGNCDYQIISQETKIISFLNGQRLTCNNFIVPSVIHLTPESNKIYDVSWSGCSTVSNANTYDGKHSAKIEYVDRKGKTVTCKFKAKGSVSFKISMKIPNNRTYQSYITMDYDGSRVKKYNNYTDGLNSYIYPSDTFVVTPGDDEEHTISFYLYLEHYKDEVSLDVYIEKNAIIEESDYNVVQIGQEAFKGCSSLESITLNEKLSMLGSNIFAGTSINTIYSYNLTPPTASPETFNGIEKSNTIIRVPASSIDLYKNADGWKEFAENCFAKIIVDPISVSLSKNSLSIVEGTSEVITANLLPQNTTENSLFWSSSNENIVRVSNGIITGISIGEAEITVTTSNNKTATCKVTVTEDVEKTIVNFKTENTGILGKTIETVKSSDISAITNALTTYDNLSSNAKDKLTSEKSLLDALKAKAEELKAAEIADAAATTEANKFKTDNATILGKNVDNITADDMDAVNKALEDYNKLSDAAKDKVTAEMVDLVSKKEKIDAIMTGINNIDASISAGKFYNLNGQRVSTKKQRIVIRKGKKFFVK